MALVQSDRTKKTVGVKPALAWSSIALLACAIVLALADKLLLGDDVPDEVWLTLIGSVVPVTVAAAAAPPALQRNADGSRPSSKV